MAGGKEIDKIISAVKKDLKSMAHYSKIQLEIDRLEAKKLDIPSDTDWDFLDDALESIVESRVKERLEKYKKALQEIK